MLDIINYIKKNGIFHVISVFYHYKIDKIIQKILNFFLQLRPLGNIIIIESHNDYDCNGEAFYQYLIKNKYNENYKIIWLLKHKLKRNLPKNVEAFYFYKPNLKKDYYICKAKYLLADNNITDKVRKDQLSIYCCHGAISLKETKGLCNVPNSVDYVLSPSVHYDEILSWELSMSFPNERMIHLGYPSEDVYFKNIDDEYNKITKKKYKKKVLWMPTFRKGGGNKRNDSNAELPIGIPLIKDEKMLNDLSDILVKLDILLTIKIHPMQDLSTIENLRKKNNIVILTGDSVKSMNIDNYRLMACSDALISDYSASAFSFLLLNRPIGFVLSDLHDYKLGLCVKNVDDYLVGHKIYNFIDFVNFLTDVCDENDEYWLERTSLIKWLYKYQDGNSCLRLAKFLRLEK